jgi:hypothetical protein
MDLEREGMNRYFIQYRQDQEIDGPVALWGQELRMNFKTLREGHNPDRGFGKRTRGGSRRITGQKLV